MKLEVSTKKLNEPGIEKIESVCGMKVERMEAHWIVAASWEGYRVAAFPISVLFSAAPPEIAVEDNGRNTGGEDNREAPSRILRKLRPKCPSKGLLDAIKLVKKAVNAISE